MKRMQEIKRQSASGITLIALVITIIVLLILAGVTLSTLFGNNGILTESKLAVEANKEANAKEQVQLAWTACETEYQSAWTKDSSVEKSNYFKKENLSKNLGTGTVDDVTYVENGESTVLYTLDGTQYTLKITNGQVYKEGEKPNISEPPTQPEVTLGNLAKNVTAANYGDYINYNVDLDDDGNNANDWRIFYNDGKNVFLIASKVLPIEKIPSIKSMEIYEDSGRKYNEVNWNDNVKGNSGASGIDKTVAEKFGLNWIKNYPSSTNTNIKCVQDLLDTSKWSEFAKGIEGAKAIGAPTLEMWINSWNQKNPNLKLFYNDGGNTNSDGNVYETENEAWSEKWENNAYLSRDLGYQIGFDLECGYFDEDDIYQSISGGMNLEYAISEGHGFSVSSAEPYCMTGSSYWIAAPNATTPWDEGQSFLYCCWEYQKCPTLGYSDSFNGSTYQLRPVVCLPSDVNATKTDNTWMINQ